MTIPEREKPGPPLFREIEPPRSTALKKV